jgi:hypothetical protein
MCCSSCLVHRYAYAVHHCHHFAELWVECSVVSCRPSLVAAGHARTIPMLCSGARARWSFLGEPSCASTWGLGRMFGRGVGEISRRSSLVRWCPDPEQSAESTVIWTLVWSCSAASGAGKTPTPTSAQERLTRARYGVSPPREPRDGTSDAAARWANATGRAGPVVFGAGEW